MNFSFNFIALNSFNYIELKNSYVQPFYLIFLENLPSICTLFLPYGNLNTSRRVTFIGNRHNDVWQPGAKLSK